MSDDMFESPLGKVTPGIHPAAETAVIEYFSQTQRNIVDRWKAEWYVTRAGQINVGNSAYQFFIVKPTLNYQESLGILKEIVVVLSNYNNFEARTLEAYDSVLKLVHQDTRIEKICYVLISQFDNIQTSLREFLSSQESQIVVPFTYSDFDTPNYDAHTIRNRFRECFHSRDLFNFSDPLKKISISLGVLNLLWKLYPDIVPI